MTITIHLPPDEEEFVSASVASGEYPSANDVVRTGLLLLREREAKRRKSAELLRDIQVGIAEADRGEVGPIDVMETWAEIETELRSGTKP